jgi:hypothetical protein
MLLRIVRAFLNPPGKYWNTSRLQPNNEIHNAIIADPVAPRVEARALIARTLDRGFESRLRHGCLSSSFHVVLPCVGRGLATS